MSRGQDMPMKMIHFPSCPCFFIKGFYAKVNKALAFFLGSAFIPFFKNVLPLKRR